MKTNQLLIVVSAVAVFGLLAVRSDEKTATNFVVPAKTSDSSPPAKVQPAKLETSDPFIVVGYLEKRDRVITIKSGPKGPVYSVATKQGKVLFENLSAEQLRAKAPEIHKFIKTGVAGDGRVLGLDARIE